MHGHCLPEAAQTGARVRELVDTLFTSGDDSPAAHHPAEQTAEGSPQASPEE